MGRILWLVMLGACSFPRGQAASDGGRDPDAIDAPADGCRATAIAASGAHTCAIRADGTVWCWGKNGQGEVGVAPLSGDSCAIGEANYYCMRSPVQAMVPVTATAIGLGDQHSCALGGGKAYCWGANDGGQFGNGNAGDSWMPVEVAARAGASAIAAGDRQTCSLQYGTLSCSGFNSEGEVGDGTTSTRYMPVVARTGVTAFGTGFHNSYAIINGFVWAWGDNADRQVDGSGNDPRATPIQLATVQNATAVAGGVGHACAVHTNKTATCWGANSDGQLGRNTTSSEEAPSAVTIASSIEQLTAATNHTCVLRSDKTVFCFGEGYGAAGMPIALAAGATQIASGSYHDCALLEDGSVWCWGWNAYGQYGSGAQSTAMANMPMRANVCAL